MLCSCIVPFSLHMKKQDWLWTAMKPFLFVFISLVKYLFHSRTFVWIFSHCTGMVFSHKYIYICERMYLNEGCILDIYLFSRFQDTVVLSSWPSLKSSLLYSWIRSVFWLISCIVPYWCWNFFHTSSFIFWMSFLWVLFVEVCNINTLLH